ncbi:uncharacterized protein LOC141909209 [Tubulanus polymorphus]|uniref:uncharacterized protein LOC141909209 n=1 Tax=Tubulanus polymorphus TaxID=672921 RepID=UPI003DA5B2AB
MSQNAPWQVQENQHQKGQVQMFDPTQFSQPAAAPGGPATSPGQQQQQQQNSSNNVNGDGWDNSWNWGDENQPNAGQQNNHQQQQQWQYDQQQNWNNYYSTQQQYGYSADSTVGQNYNDTSNQNYGDTGSFNQSWNNPEQAANDWSNINQQQWYAQQPVGGADSFNYANTAVDQAGAVTYGDDRNTNNVDPSAAASTTMNYQQYDGFQGVVDYTSSAQPNHIDARYDHDDGGTASAFFGKNDDYDDSGIVNAAPPPQPSSTADQMQDINLGDDSTGNNESGNSDAFGEHSRQSSYGGGASFVIGSGPNSRRTSALPDDVQTFTPSNPAVESAQIPAQTTSLLSENVAVNESFQTRSYGDSYHQDSFQGQRYQSQTSVDSFNSERAAVLDSFAPNQNHSRPASAVEQNARPIGLFDPASQSLPASPHPASRATPTSPAAGYFQQPAQIPASEPSRSRPPSSHSTKSHDSFVASSVHSDSMPTTNRSPASTPYSGSIRGPSPLARDMSPVQKSNDNAAHHQHHNHPPRNLPAMQALQEHGSETILNDAASIGVQSQPINIPGQPPTDLPISPNEHAMSIYHSPIQPHPNSLFRPVGKVVTPTEPDQNRKLGGSTENVANVETDQPGMTTTQPPPVRLPQMDQHQQAGPASSHTPQPQTICSH